MKNELEQALSEIYGVERSEVELSETGPLGIRVGLARGADRTAVAEAVQRLLESRGLRSRVAPDRRQPGPAEPPAPPAEPRRPMPTPGPIPGPPAAVADSPRPSSQPAGLTGIEVVTVSETVEGVLVTVVADGGRTAMRRARPTEQALHEAIVSAVGELIDPEAPPAGLRAVEHSEAFQAMTVYVEGEDGRVRAGASVVAAGNPFAFAQAVWAALR